MSTVLEEIKVSPARFYSMGAALCDRRSMLLYFTGTFFPISFPVSALLSVCILLLV